MRQVRTLGLLGTGVIGGGWAARALHFGVDVIAADVKPEMEAWIRGAVENAEHALARLTLAPLPAKGRLSFTTDLAAMARRADFIQENIPEQVELKQRVLADISREAPPEVLIASSTSGIMPSELQRAMHAPERFLVAHPFNPVYLLPLVELVGGVATSAATIETARRFYTDIGMHPLHVRCEIPGHLADRLQEALWREILHLVNDGVATTGELDESIIYGPGLRWAAMGTNLIYHLAGGEPGMRHMLRQFGPCLKWPWTKLAAPELTDALIDRMVAGTQAQAGSRSIRELERLRDDYLVDIQQALRRYDIGAGATLRALEERLYERAGGVDSRPSASGTTGTGTRSGKTPPAGPIGTPGAAGALRQIADSGSLDHSSSGGLQRRTLQVRPEWVDYNGHMTDSRYLQVFGDATDALFRRAGIDDAYRRAGLAMFTAETHVTHSAEAKALEELYVTSQLLAVDDKRAHLMHSLHRARDDELLATGEQLYLHVDTNSGRVCAMESRVRAGLQSIHEQHAHLPQPPQKGRHVGMPPISRSAVTIRPSPPGGV